MTTDTTSQTVLRSRKDVPSSDCWDTKSLYASREAWKKDLENLCGKEAPFWPHLNEKQFHIEQPSSLYKLLTEVFSIERTLEKLYVYAHLTHDEDISNQEATADLKSITYLLTSFSEEISWIQPALIALPQKISEELLTSPELQTYHFYLKKIFRLAPHTGTSREEKILASSSPALEVAYKTFSSLTDSEIPFGEAVDSEGKSHPLSHALSSLYMQSPDRELRKSAYQKQCQRYHGYRLSLANLLNGKIQAHLFNAKAHNYKSCLEAALFQNNISTSVVTTLIETVKQHTHLITKYFQLKQKALGLPDFHFYDVYAPIAASEFARHYSYEEAVSLICDSLTPLGDNYVEALRKGLTSEGWVDKYENQNKRSGAYSSGCYDSKPYILLNYTGTLYDVSVVAHEGGHSMHSFLSHKHQQYHEAQYPIFLAEIASTLNETLLMEFLLKNAPSKEEKIAILSRSLDTIFATLFRQTLFADFELEAHSAAEQGIPLTEEFFSQSYKKLQHIFYGDCVTFDELSSIEWARIPHFYYNFYVYQYATGIIASLCFSEKILSKEAGAQEAYLTFLQSGGSDFPIEILKKSGLDMTSSAPMLKAFSYIERKLDELTNLL
ncbi:oligoendopeptidase F [Chlamydia muridarum str. Nigg]|uniref:Oligopeptidase F n=2 Tax=Chlamydia muridarum TaxID=83560 RepID=A0A069ZYU2_CHLMR|nr:oligoendopeptidase F [Chlamydia muridarum]UFT40126.1 oligoendopeptidase F [Chlamydia trachomatis]AAF39245.1 oligoendopeptidase F [Chlamydia muridarum str. Nigg]AHH22774.1 oligoendopeptidase F [Chlamydia muridarum str. Nigg3 CMUT3-5]AHH23699.1 oligoendopeptidase F [Chlamydia muridarum str. Nigg CM972]AID37913.1 oligoendopeptidase F [Chlamydia muridarum str. Nigg 2 MCR]